MFTTQEQATAIVKKYLSDFLSDISEFVHDIYIYIAICYNIVACIACTDALLCTVHP